MARKKGPRKITYQSKGNVFPTIVLTGNVFTKFIDDDEDKVFMPRKGDLMLFIHISTANNNEPWNYERLGRTGYVKADIHDGFGFKPLSLEEFFEHREYYFSKTERPIDTIALCATHLKSFANRECLRLYREHYVLKPEGMMTIAPETEDKK